MFSRSLLRTSALAARRQLPITARVAINPIARTSIASTRSYHEKVIDHYENPRNVGTLNKNDINVGTGLVGAPACGDVMRLQIDVDPETNVIRDVKFKTFGCGSAIASSSYVTELVKGKTLDEALKIKNTAIAKELSLPPVKLHCSMLAEDAIKSAVKDYRSKRLVKQPTLGPEATAAAASASA
ncbi:iron sulfur cluster assembly protein 1, mitochondrial [Scheffersomyces xylosifermentans]|uniref:iron sulfur cluster assembly protein 1, mitochondrial n=1 Tax=Scheffersomyces xylosifermentans TaxID=1304137 RepID=UPI00315CEE7B